ncbi:hypothetical protein [Virgibacillus ihumii]|uniref:hypothetical protein n=1 Tax=Virgibacillus ihumii TaxID=2686091 RepID=UPI00157C40AD|nr:hypothetical protein [Virgibacillus ihumii]
MSTTQSIQTYMRREWDYYDKHLGKALVAVENGNLYNASVSFQRIAWTLRSLDKYHPPNHRKHKEERD